MSPQERWLPLFPLNAVLIPGASLPLQIFEERYKQMLEDCLASDSKFGVVLIKAGSEVGEPAIPYPIGTMAHIVQVNRVQNGRVFIAFYGQRRFRIKDITQYRPYMGAEVTLLDETAGEPIPDQEMQSIRKAITEYSRLLLGLRGGWVRESRLPSNPVALSYHIAEVLEAELIEKQALLEKATASERLDVEMVLLNKGNATLKRRVAQELTGRFSVH